MARLAMGDVTRILQAMRAGDAQSTERLLETLYAELRQLAAQKLAREQAGHTLQATALVHEAYLRLLGGEADWQNRGHFFAAAAEAMRRILIESARSKARLKRGGDRQREPLDEALAVVPPVSIDVLALDEALEKLAAEDPVKAQLVKLRFFAGLTLEQCALVLGISRATADRHWAYARAWLFHEMQGGAAD